MNKLAGAIADLVQKVVAHLGYERGAICAVDCVRQWDEGGGPLLEQTMKAWERRLANPDGPHTDTERHGAWVPAIPLE